MAAKEVSFDFIIIPSPKKDWYEIENWSSLEPVEGLSLSVRLIEVFADFPTRHMS